MCASVSTSVFLLPAPAATDIYTLSLHDALPICRAPQASAISSGVSSITPRGARAREAPRAPPPGRRSEEHTSELQSHSDLVCRLLLEKKKTVRSCTLLTRVGTLRSLLRPYAWTA